MQIKRSTSSRRWLSLIGGLILTSPIGCGQTTASKPTVSPTAIKQLSSSEELPVVPRAEYHNWNQFPVGTVVTRVREIGDGPDKIVQTIRYKLAEKSDKQVVIEPELNMESRGRHEQNAMGTIEYPATFRLPKGMTEAMFSQPDPKAESLGQEEIELLGKKIQVDVFTWKTSAEAGTVTNKVWMSNEVPGRVIKHQTEVVGRKTEEVVTSISVPESAVP